MSLSQPLFETPEKLIYSEDFVAACRRLGIQLGDTLLVHSDVGVFGKLALFNRHILFQSIVDALYHSVGTEGNLVMPTFTYSFCKNEMYDSGTTPSTVGALTEFFRQQPDVVRTRHPIFSFAIKGKDSAFFQDISPDAFGKQSVFEKLHEKRGKILFLGASFDACTFVHYIEQAHGVPYRFMKTFYGKTKVGDQVSDDVANYFVRYLDRNVNLYLKRFEDTLLEKQCLRQTHLGNGHLKVIAIDTLYQEGYQLLDRDINYFLKETPKS